MTFAAILTTLAGSAWLVPLGMVAGLSMIAMAYLLRERA